MAEAVVLANERDSVPDRSRGSPYKRLNRGVSATGKAALVDVVGRSLRPEVLIQPNDVR